MQQIPVPKHKKDWPGHTLLLQKSFPEGRVEELLVRIERRLNAMDTIHTSHDVSHWGSVRILKVSWNCDWCNAYHSGYLPESFVAEAKVAFVEKEECITLKINAHKGITSKE